MSEGRSEGHRSIARARKGRWALRIAAAIASMAILFTALLPVFGGSRAVVILSGSMRKTAPVGSLVVTRNMAARNVRVGTIVLVRVGGASRATPLTLHRVVSVDRTS